MTTTSSLHRTAPEQTRRDLAAGASALIAGLALVGVGAPESGSVVTLAGLLLTIWAIHSFGRLGPDEPEAPRLAEKVEREVARKLGVQAMIRSAAIFVAGAAVVASPYLGGATAGDWGPVAGAAIAFGIVGMVLGFRAYRAA